MQFVVVGAVLGFLSVAGGAFGAHALKSRLTPADLAIYETAIRYQFFHTLALLAVGLVGLSHPSRLLETSGWLFLAGIVIFSGTLYGVSLLGIRWLGAVTPFGGLCLLAGWGVLAAAAWSLR